MYRHPLNLDGLFGPVLLVDLGLLDLGQRDEALVADELAKHRVEAIKMRRLVEEDEELAAVGAGSLVGHADDTALVVPERRSDLVLEGWAVDGAAALGVLGRRVRGRARLRHEVGDQPVEGRAIVVVGRAEGEEVLKEKDVSVRLGTNVTPKNKLLCAKPPFQRGGARDGFGEGVGEYE